jgi:hypothetical protein
MNTPRSSLVRVVLFAIGCVFGLAIVQLAGAASTSTLAPLADQAPALPLTTSFAKAAPGPNGGPYTLTLKNTSAAALKVSGKVDLSVVSHATAKSRELPAHVIPAGGTWAINDLVAADKVTLTADGFVPLTLTVP